MKDVSFKEWVQKEVDSHKYWFHKIDLGMGITTPGWSDPVVDKLPYYGLPDDMAKMKVLDIGASEGFFSFEAERRGAKVQAIDSWQDAIDRFNICKAALSSKVQDNLCSVYDLNPEGWGTYDLVMYFGVLYHLKDPYRSIEAVKSVCSNRLLLQTNVCGSKESVAEFYPHGVRSGPNKELVDKTVFWVPSRRCVIDLLDANGFKDIKEINHEPFVVEAFVDKQESKKPDLSLKKYA